MTETLFTPVALGGLRLPNRVLMAPLTRNRALHDGDVPQPLNAQYYRQRASAGLIITEATQISPEGKGYAWTPGIHSDAQVAGWRGVVDAVHEAGGRIALQLWHVGRVSHISLQPDGQAPVAPSAIAASTQTFDGNGFVATSMPRALNLDEIARIVADFAAAAARAKDAGFDAIELHGANGYLVDQFLRDGANRRDDDYGGSIPNRVRFLGDVLEALAGVWPADRIGLRLSPFADANGVSDSDPVATFHAAIARAQSLGLGYLHMVEGRLPHEDAAAPSQALTAIRTAWHGAYVANGNYDRERAIAAVASGEADAVAFGRLFLANPDLPRRLEIAAPLNAPDRATFYGGGDAGYTDYPTLGDEAARSA